MPRRLEYRGRRAAAIENGAVRVTVLEEGGHIAEVCDLATGVNPLWTPPWPSIEPSAYAPGAHPEYGTGPEAVLLAGIMGHNLCLDVFGGPSDTEAAAGLPVHGEASTAAYDISGRGDSLVMRAELPLARLRVERDIALHGRAVRIRERVDNLTGVDRPIGWTQHATLGPPFLEKGETMFRASVTRSRVHEERFGADDYLQPGADFTWPHAPCTGGGTCDLRRLTDRPASSAFTAHLADPELDRAYVLAFSPRARLAFGYVWQRADFPWLGLWEENSSRSGPPWKGRTLTRGLEFGVSPFPEGRRKAVGRGHLFGTPTFAWIPAASHVSVEYWCVSRAAHAIPETLDIPA